jgi:replicative superfamily II helicase
MIVRAGSSVGDGSNQRKMPAEADVFLLGKALISVATDKYFIVFVNSKTMTIRCALLSLSFLRALH